MLEHLTLILKSIFIENMIFATFLGICSYLTVSKEVSTAIGLGAATVPIQTLAIPINWLLNECILKRSVLRWLGEEYANYDLSFLTYTLFITTIATMVQLVEIVVEKFSPSLYNSLGTFLPLIAVNCAILGGSLFMQSRTKMTHSFGFSIVYGVNSRLGRAIAILALAAMRRKIRYLHVPAPLCGLGITFTTTGPVTIGFMSFDGMLTGGSNKKEESKRKTAIRQEVKADNLANNTKGLSNDISK